jgi:uncharacterized protein (DUF305 family)
MKNLMRITVALFAFLLMSSVSYSQTDTTKRSTGTSTAMDKDHDANYDNDNDINRREGKAVIPDNDMTRNTDRENESENLMDDINDMHEKMAKVDLIGDFDTDFANMMIEHHQGAIDMCRTLVNKSENEQLKDIAKMTIDKKQGDIGILRDFDKKDKDEVTKKHDVNILRNAVKDNTTTISSSLNGDVDHDFITLMTAHHQKAIELAKLELEHGMSPMLKDMAKKMIDDEQKEIGKLKEVKAGK